MQDDVRPLSDQQLARIKELELRVVRSKPEDYELQDLYLHRWLYSKIQLSLYNKDVREQRKRIKDAK